jgi:hypothetical protein
MIPIQRNEPCVLVETARWGDVEFFGKWLLAANKANQLWKQARMDRGFAKQIDRLEVVYIPDFGMAALALLLELRGQVTSFILRLDTEEGELFAMMVEMGFFVLTGDRYQMVIPERLTINKVKSALIRVARTEDAEFVLHIEHLIKTMPYVEAKAWQRRLGALHEDHRVADRLVLLDD